MAWGDNNDGQLGNGTTTTEKEPVEVKGLTEASGGGGRRQFHSLALLKSGKVKAWGDNNDGQLGNGTTTTEKEPVEVKGLTEVVAIAAGPTSQPRRSEKRQGQGLGRQQRRPARQRHDDDREGTGGSRRSSPKPSRVAGGEFHSLALLKNGKVMAWGDNNDGQLGNGTTTTEKEPVEVKGLERSRWGRGRTHPQPGGLEKRQGHGLGQTTTMASSATARRRPRRNRRKSQAITEAVADGGRRVRTVSRC